MRNENTALKNRNTLFVGMSGSGKSQALKQLGSYRQSSRVVMFDPNSDHKMPGLLRARGRGELLDALLKGAKAGNFRVAYTPAGDEREEEHEFFCRAVLHLLDGSRPTNIVDEELAQSCKSPMRAERYHKKLMNEGRKYGLIYEGAVQLPQRVPKDVYDNCELLIIGKSLRLPKYVIDRLPDGVEKQVRTLEPLNFIKCKPDGTAEKLKIKYRADL